MPLTRHLTRAAGTAVLAAALWAGAAPATAEPPQRLAGEVSDTAGVLRDEAAVRAALDELADTTDLQLFVTYVDTFDGMDPVTWADTTAERSNLGTDDILLAVAVEDRVYQVSAAPDLSLSDAELRDVETDHIEPHLRDGDWDGAAIAAAGAYADATRPSGTPRVVVAVLGVLVLVGATALVVRAVRRRRAARAELSALEDRASVALVRTDDAIATWARELDYAEAELGRESLGDLPAALPPARDRLTAAFAARSAADDADDDAARRTALTGVVATCEAVAATIAESTAALSGLRDLHTHAPQLLGDLAARARHVTTDAGAAAEQVEALRTRWAASATAAVADHPAQAEALAAEAAQVVARGQAALEPDRTAAVQAVGAADELLDRAEALLEQVRTRAADLEDAPADVASATASVTADLDDAQRLGGDDPAVAQAAARAREVLALAGASLTGGDPIAALADLAQAEGALDAALVPHREQQERLQRARRRVDEQLPRVLRDIDTTESLVRAHRGTVGAWARQQLSEAREQARVAGALSDPVTAVAALDRAQQTVAAAQRAARQEIEDARSDAGGVGYGGGSGGFGFGFGGGSGGGYRASRSRSSSSSSRSRSGSSSRRSSGGRSRGSSGRSRRGGGGRF
ncbi:TPM domain-containing protein [Cellulomonas shaoxiangyii]|uniref:TPM domain-containing protein n=1 Tax=Cellulomonas shaoxiangyii TaxID=2566013 RepID=UPI00140E1408|nr:TPM domain-containing protein [Cellulomonas shaoxiangyii]